MAIRFGTSGWRAIIADVSFENVRLVTEAISKLLTPVKSVAMSEPLRVIASLMTDPGTAKFSFGTALPLPPAVVFDPPSGATSSISTLRVSGELTVGRFAYLSRRMEELSIRIASLREQFAELVDIFNANGREPEPGGRLRAITSQLEEYHMEDSYIAESVSTLEEEFVARARAKWAFFKPDIDITNDILRLGEAMGDCQRAAAREALYQKEKEDIFEDLSDEEKIEAGNNLKDVKWRSGVIEALWNVIFHNKKESSAEADEDEYPAYFQKYVAEKMYNHLAMLTRSKRAREGGEFSMRKEFTKAIAPKLGLGLYLRDETDAQLKEETGKVLERLALDFEDWFMEEKDGLLETSFGFVCSLEFSVDHYEKLDRFSSLLILAADVSENGRGWTDIAREERQRLAAGAASGDTVSVYTGGADEAGQPAVAVENEEEMSDAVLRAEA